VPRPTQPSIPTGSVNEDQLRLRRQRYDSFHSRINARVAGKLCDPMTTRAVLERFCSVVSSQTGGISNVLLPLPLPPPLLIGFVVGQIRWPWGVLSRENVLGTIVRGDTLSFTCVVDAVGTWEYGVHKCTVCSDIVLLSVYTTTALMCSLMDQVLFQRMPVSAADANTGRALRDGLQRCSGGDTRDLSSLDGATSQDVGVCCTAYCIATVVQRVIYGVSRDVK